MVQELLDMQTGRVYRRAGDGEWEEQFVDEGGEVAALLGNAPYVRAQAATSKLATGSVVVNFSNSWGTLFNDSIVRSLIGRSFNQATDCVTVMNGDKNARQDASLTPVYNAATKEVNLRAIEAAPSGNIIVSGAVRINYALLAG